MSLQTDIIFQHALASKESFVTAVDGRIYNTAIPLPDEDLMNVPLPYAIVSFDGMTNDETTKDDPFEGEYDSVTIGVLLVAKTREELATLSQDARDAIHDYFLDVPDDDEDYNLVPEDYRVSAQGVQYDSLKPCYWIRLNYQCDTIV